MKLHLFLIIEDFYFPVIQKYWHGICFQYPYDGCTENSSHFKHWDFKFFDLPGKPYPVERAQKMGPGILGSKKMRKKGDEASSFFVLAAFFFFACGPCPTSSFKTLGHFFQWKNILLSTYITDEKFRF